MILPLLPGEERFRGFRVFRGCLYLASYFYLLFQVANVGIKTEWREG